MREKNLTQGGNIMNKTKKQTDFKEKERVHTIVTGEDEALHFSVVEVAGKVRADIRYFSKEDQNIWPTSRGILVDPKKLNDLGEGVRKLTERFQKK